MNYGQLWANLIALLNRRDCTTDQAKSFIQNALTRINRELRCPAMEKTVVATIGSGYTGLTIPSDFLELINLIPVSQTYDQRRLTKCDISLAKQLAINVGSPAKYCREGPQWIIGPAPAEGDQIQIDYYAEIGALTNDSDTNVISIIASDLIIYCALSYAADFFSDKRGDKWESRYQQIRNQLQIMADDDEESGAVQVQPAYAYPDELGDYWYPYGSLPVF